MTIATGILPAMEADRLPRHFVHETALVEPGAVLGDDVRVWHHAHVRRGATIGVGTSLGKNVYVGENVVIGARVKIQNNVSVYEGVQVEDEVLVGPSAVFTNDRYPRAQNPGWQIVPTFVRRGASVGANATIVCGVEIGNWAIVAAGAVVTHDVAAHEVVAGNPARRLGWACECGQVLVRTAAARPRARCPECGRSLEPNDT